MQRDVDEKWMRLALELAQRGEGFVEPNPMVGCVVVRDERAIGQGFHRRFGEAHAEVNALIRAPDAVGATAYVTLEPCCHQGKTPPCTNALLVARVARVVVATLDPFSQVSGGGVQQLREAGVQVDVGVLEPEAMQLNAPYFKRVQTGRPWVIAKWAMTLDGKIATASLDSRWISSEPSREFVHQIRGRVDAIIVGSRTAQHDDPLLTARPPGSRYATRVVFDSRLELSPSSQLVRTVADAPVLLVAQNPAPDRQQLFEKLGCQVFDTAASQNSGSVDIVLEELGRRGMTNVLVEGGSMLLGSFFDARQIDEVIVFVAPKLIGGEAALSPIDGQGISQMSDAIQLGDFKSTRFGNDICLRGRLAWEAKP